MDTSYKLITLLTILTVLAFSSLAGNRTQPQTKLLPVTTGSISLNVTVTNEKGELVAGLNQTAFEILVDKQAANIVSFSQDDSPVSVGILFDSSGSMRGLRGEKSTLKMFDTLRQALARFLELSHPSNEYFLVGFNYRPQLLADWTSDHTRIVNQLSDFYTYGNTAFYDAAYLAVDKLQNSRHSKRALLLISDGQDNTSRYTFNELRDLLRSAGLLIYSITLPGAISDGSSVDRLGRDVLRELSTLSGGIAFYIKDGTALKPKDAYTVFEYIANELRNQYTIIIMPNETSEGKKYRKVKVKLNPSRATPRDMKHLTVRTREGFYRS